MADYFLHDDIVCNILARLPAKPLLRFRCVSKHWNRMLRKPSFMKLRSRKTILVPHLQSFHHIDDDNANSMVTRPLPTNIECKYVPRIIGTFNGIVVLITFNNFFLYNPFTCVSKKLPRLITSNQHSVYGFGHAYGDEQDLKVIKFIKPLNTCDVYNFKHGSWTNIKYDNRCRYYFENDVGTYTNGLLYWIARDTNMLIVLDVKDMLFSEMNLPFEQPGLLGTVGGSLCAIRTCTMWVMKEHNQWSKLYTFKLRIPNADSYNPLCILESGRILTVVQGPSMNLLVIYDPTNHSWNTVSVSFQDKYLWGMHVLEYVESLVSPLNIMSRARRSKRRLSSSCSVNPTISKAMVGSDSLTSTS